LTNTINYAPASKPFIITAVIILFLGSSIGSVWMMSIFGTDLPQWFHGTFQLHKMLQTDPLLEAQKYYYEVKRKAAEKMEQRKEREHY
jgi:hypothetical protein